MKRITLLFPGQGAQYIGMGLDFYREFPAAKQLFEEADDILKQKLSTLIFEGDEAVLTQTRNSQPAIYVVSMALLKVLQTLYPQLQPAATAGLSLGEYSALTASGKLSFQEGLQLVQARAAAMHEACETTQGAMSVILGLDDSLVEEAISSLQMPQEIWCANFNCPGQVVISGTKKGVEEGSKACLEKGAKRALPLQVHGAFHSGLMKSAEEKLRPIMMETRFQKSAIPTASNVNGDCVDAPETIRELLLKQITYPVRWQKCVRTLDPTTDLFLEIGCGKTLAGLNKRIGPQAATHSLEKVEDLKNMESLFV